MKKLIVSIALFSLSLVAKSNDITIIVDILNHNDNVQSFLLTKGFKVTKYDFQQKVVYKNGNEKIIIYYNDSPDIKDIVYYPVNNISIDEKEIKEYNWSLKHCKDKTYYAFKSNNKNYYLTKSNKSNNIIITNI